MRCPPGSSATPTDARTASATRRVSFFDSDSSRNLGLGRERARIATPARPAPNCLQNPNRIVFNCVATIALVFCVFGAYPFTRQFSALDIMSQAHGLGSCVRCPVVIRLGAWRLGSLDLPLDFLANAGPHLFFCVLLTRLSDSRSHRAARNLACQRLPGSSRPVPWPPCPPVVCTYAALVFKQLAYVAGVVLDGDVCIALACLEYLAARDARDLFRLFLVVRERCTGFLWLSVRRYAARSWIHLAFLCPSGYPPRLGRSAAANTRQSLPSAMGVVPHLLRIGHRKDRQRRSPVAQLDRDGRVLPEWAVAHLDRLVCAASAALVSCFERIRHACAGVGSGVDAVPASALADRMLLYRHPMGSRCHSYG